MIIYVVTVGEYEDYQIMGVFTDRLLAQKYAINLINSDSYYEPVYVEEYDVVEEFASEYDVIEEFASENDSTNVLVNIYGLYLPDTDIFEFFNESYKKEHSFKRASYAKKRQLNPTYYSAELGIEFDIYVPLAEYNFDPKKTALDSIKRYLKEEV